MNFIRRSRSTIAIAFGRVVYAQHDAEASDYVPIGFSLDLPGHVRTGVPVLELSVHAVGPVADSHVEPLRDGEAALLARIFDFAKT